MVFFLCDWNMPQFSIKFSPTKPHLHHKRKEEKRKGSHVTFVDKT